MNKINILDCTLRDGGYINEFNFGKAVISAIVQKLSVAGIDIIECGFLKSGAIDANKSLFGNVEMIRDVIGEKHPNSMYVAMIQYGAISNDEISPYDGTSIDGIRLTFHEHEIDSAVEMGMQLMEKGYKVFMQPVGTMAYTDEKLINLIKRINEMMPFAFYMVDTLGTMYRNDLRRMFYLVDHNLNKRIVVGFHSHNNLQMSFANAQEFIQISNNRQIIVDASVYGMGRGAGNLNTELLVRFINNNIELTYDALPILEILDDYIRPLRKEYQWGYDGAYYVAAITGCHPNYARFLMNRETLQVRDIHAILESLDENKRHLFDKKYIAERYEHYMNHHVEDDEVKSFVSNNIANKKVLVIAPGKSVKKSKDRILKFIEAENPYVVSVNFVPKEIPVDLTFISNLKRFKNINELMVGVAGKYVIITSNIATNTNYDNLMIVDFSSYLNEDDVISDNAGIMCINFLKKCGMDDLFLAGFDGFSPDWRENYYENSMAFDMESNRAYEMNKAVSQKFSQLKKQIKIDFLQDSIYQKEIE